METIRQQMIGLLSEQSMTGRELSKALGIREREVYDHLTHIARSAASLGKRLTILPFQCMACGYTFKERRRFTPPGRCPQCKKGHVERPAYVIT
ncbi:transcriptional regulator [Thermodesulfobacteriota bacterium]